MLVSQAHQQRGQRAGASCAEQSPAPLCCPRRPRAHCSEAADGPGARVSQLGGGKPDAQVPPPPRSSTVVPRRFPHLLFFFCFSSSVSVWLTHICFRSLTCGSAPLAVMLCPLLAGPSAIPPCDHGRCSISPHDQVTHTRVWTSCSPRPLPAFQPPATFALCVYGSDSFLFSWFVTAVCLDSAYRWSPRIFVLV